MNREIKARIKNSLQAVEKASDREALIFIDDKGSYLLNKHARDFLCQRKIPVGDFMEWVMIGSSHLQNLCFGEILVRMMHLPENNVLVFLNNADPDKKIGKPILTAKEREVLRYIVKGFSNKQIAELMKISPGTVNSHLDKIYLKLGCSNRVAAGFLGLKNGLFLPA